MAITAAEAESTDPTVYPTEERVGEDILQRWIIEIFRPLLQLWLNDDRGIKAFVGADQFVYYKRYDSHKRVAPDTYVLPGVDPLTHVRSWKIFETHIVPSFALEVVSKDWEKDYIDAPIAYDEAGVGELVVFDPFFESSSERYRFQVFRRTGKRGLVRVEVTNEDRVRSRALGCFLRAVGANRFVRLRLASGSHGDRIVPTMEERERTEKERERTEKEAALARVATLERQVARARAHHVRKPRRKA
jgi:Uma2 family endonuclease